MLKRWKIGQWSGISLYVSFYRPHSLAVILGLGPQWHLLYSHHYLHLQPQMVESTVQLNRDAETTFKVLNVCEL